MYLNSTLNIKIDLPSLKCFKITESITSVDLLKNNVLILTVYRNSNVKISNDSGRVQVNLYGESIVDAYKKTKVFAWNNSFVRLHNDTKAILHDKTEALAKDNSKVEAKGKSIVYGHDKSSILAYEESNVKAYGNCIVEAHHKTNIYATQKATVVAYNHSKLILRDYVKASVYNNSFVKAYNLVEVIAHDSSIVTAEQNVKIKALNFSMIRVDSNTVKVTQENHFGAIVTQSFKTKKNILVYKKLRDDLIATLEIEKGQVFQSENYGKCRTSKAKVISIKDMKTSDEYTKGYSIYEPNFVYVVGETVKSKYNKQIKECSSGIHFFLTREEAEKY